MKRLLAYASAIFLAAPGIYFVIEYAELLNDFEKIAAIVFPVLLGLSFYFISSWSTEQALSRLQSKIDQRFTALVDEHRVGRVRIYDTKKSVPGGAEFWNNLVKEAEKRFVIVGTTNKSWFNKDAEQSKRLVEEFARIKRNGGSVTVIAQNKSANIDMMRRFISNYCDSNVSGENNLFAFKTITALNYGAILNDQRIVMMPLPFEDGFREETLVIELLESEVPAVFHNYASDVERLVGNSLDTEIWEGSPKVELVGHVRI